MNLQKNAPKTRNYQNLLAVVGSIKKTILLSLVGVVVVQMAMMGLILIKYRPTEQKFTPMESCYYGMNAIFSQSPDKKLLHPTVIKDMQKYTFNVERISSVRVIDSYTCVVVAKFANKMRSYFIQLEKSANNPHLYRIRDVRGRAVK